MTTSPSDITLPSLVSGNYELIYAIPMLVAAIPTTFMGAFLTLDRTRTFASQVPGDSMPGGFVNEKSTSTKLRRLLGFEGGIGGLCGGWLFGSYLSTLLALVIMNKTSSAPLTPIQFTLVHIMSSTLFLFFGGRFRIGALAFIGLAGGLSFALAISVILHPALETRLVFVAILTPIAAIATLLPLVRTQHCALRAASAATGSFGMILSISLLSHDSSWQNVWERLWLPHSIRGDWGTGIERGFSAVVSVTFALGIFTDWAARRFIGENPDQKWDSYLARYAATLPSNSDRAGSFQPFLSLWQRIFHPPPPDPIKFPSDEELKSDKRPTSPDVVTYTDIKRRLSKRKPRPFRKRSDVKFKPIGEYSDSDTESESELDKKPAPSPFAYPLPQRPWLNRNLTSSPTLSGVTVYGSDDELPEKSKRGFKRISEVENYSDLEGEDITTSAKNSPLKRAKSHREEPGWKPGFLARNSDPIQTSSTAPQPPPGAVPMTPSLIRAISRIAIAQKEAYTPGMPALPPPPVQSEETKEEWKGF
ncbi:hypothetical protein M422DRAFT_24657 [Sphaerobolus stellatus SS14]|nr:hypothetical protein M422DRAFT_24657 [Sphaerobolus stellatus SS14]